MINQAGTVLLSKRIENDDAALLYVIVATAEIAAGGEACWATDLNAGGAALLIEFLAAHIHFSTSACLDAQSLSCF